MQTDRTLDRASRRERASTREIGGLCVRVVWGVVGVNRESMNETTYHHVATEATGFSEVCVCVQSLNVFARVCVCVAHVGGRVRAGVLHGVKFQG